MCYAGGPRCYADAKKDYDKALEKLKNFKEEHGDEDQINAQGFGTLREYRALKKDVTDKRVDLQQTKEFVDELSEALDSGSVSGNLEEAVTKTMHESKAGYDAQLLAFDQRNNTVLARNPSKYGTKEGIAHLAKKVELAQSKSPKEQEAALRSYEHAVATRERILNRDVQLPADFEAWKKPESPESLPTGNLPQQLEHAERDHRLAVKGLQQMMRDNAQNPFTVRHRTNLAIREAKIAETEEKVARIKKAMNATEGTQDYGTHQQAYQLYTENNKMLESLRTRIHMEEQTARQRGSHNDLHALKARAEEIKAQQKEITLFLNSEIRTK